VSLWDPFENESSAHKDSMIIIIRNWTPQKKGLVAFHLKKFAEVWRNKSKMRTMFQKRFRHLIVGFTFHFYRMHRPIVFYEAQRRKRVLGNPWRVLADEVTSMVML